MPIVGAVLVDGADDESVISVVDWFSVKWTRVNAIIFSLMPQGDIQCACMFYWIKWKEVVYFLI